MVGLAAPLLPTLVEAAPDAGSLPKPENNLTPAAAFERLLAGNQRFVQGVAKRYNLVDQRLDLASAQNPYAAILCCADSRVAPEYAFDSALGDLFVVRVAGNFANDDGLASFEYAVSMLNTPVLMVLGHERCGAVVAAMEQVNAGTQFPGHIPSLTKALAPSVIKSANQEGNAQLNAIRQVVIDTVQALPRRSVILDAAVKENRLKIVGGVYRLASGEVELI
jgi:carbonic anhydrase